MYIYLDLGSGKKLRTYNDPPVIVFELVSPGAHLWLLDVDGWHIPCRTELDCCSSGMSIESALKNVDDWSVHYILWEVVPGVYHTLGASLNSFRLWQRSPVELNVKNLEEYISSYPFRILNTCNMSALSLLN